MGQGLDLRLGTGRRLLELQAAPIILQAVPLLLQARQLERNLATLVTHGHHD